MERRGHMITIGDILKESSIDLGLKMANREEAIFHVASLLKEDARVTDWNSFYAGLKSKDPCLATASDLRICIPHTRTDSVNDMVMSAGRSDGGIRMAGGSAPIHFIFVIGVPAALAADYLRIIGALARIFRSPEAEARFGNAQSPAEFLQLLGAAEMKL